MKVTSFRATGPIRPSFKDNLVAGTNLLYKSYHSDKVFCSFRRKIMTPDGSETYMLDLSQNQHAVWAMGPLGDDNLPVLHNFKAASGGPIDIRFMVCKKSVVLGFKSHSWKHWEEKIKFQKLFSKLSKEKCPPIRLCFQVTQPVFTILKSTMEAPEHCVKSVQSWK